MAVSPNSIQILSRAFSVIDVLSRAEGPLLLGDIASQCELPKSTTHRIVNALVADNYVKIIPRGYYTIGNGMVCLAARSLRGGILFQIGDIPNILRDITRQTVYIGTLINFDIIYLHKVPGDISTYSEVGMYGKAHCSATGKAILASMKWDIVHNLVLKYGLKQMTSDSIMNEDFLYDELTLTRQRGYALCDGEFVTRSMSIAMPIFDYSGQCVAALCLAAVKGTDIADIEQFEPVLRKKTIELTERMGHVAKQKDSINLYYRAGLGETI